MSAVVFLVVLIAMGLLVWAFTEPVDCGHADCPERKCLHGDDRT